MTLLTLLSSEVILQLTIIVPLLGMIAIIATGSYPNLREAISILSSVILISLVYTLYTDVTAGSKISVTWISLFPGLKISFNIEPLGVLFALIASILWLLTTLYSIGYMRSHKEKQQTRFYAFFAFAIASVMGIAFAENLLTLFIFYETLTLSTYPLVTHSGTNEAKKSGRLYLAILIGTSISFFLVAIISSYSLTGTLDFTSGGIFSKNESPKIMGILLVLFIFGIAKTAIMPFHRWLPAAMVAPTPVSALLHAVAVVKAGVFTVLKVSIYIFGINTIPTLPTTQTLLYIACLTILVASIIAMRQDNLKARLAYSTISQLSYIIVGALLANSAAITASAMHLTMHAFAKITLFFCAGAIMLASKQTNVSKMRGLGKHMPITMTAFFIASLSIIGIPPAGGTWSKMYLLLGTLEAEQWFLLVILLLSSLLNIVYLLAIPLRAFFPGDNVLANNNINEAPIFSLIALSLSALGCIVLFFLTQPLFNLITLIPL